MNLFEDIFKGYGEEISSIQWQELKKIFRLFSDYNKLLSIEEIWWTFYSGAPKFWENWEKRIWPAKIPKDPASKCENDISNWLSVFKEKDSKDHDTEL